MKNILFALIIFISPLLLTAQHVKNITLNYCLQKALQHAPQSSLPAIYKEMSKLKTKNISINYLPTLNINGQATYQSDVTKVPLPPSPIFSIEPINKDWYKLNLDIKQIIWDGGFTSAQKKVEQNNLKISNREVSIQTYGIKEKVIRLFFTALFFRDNIAVLKIVQKNMNTKIKEAQNAVNNGILLQADLNALKVENKIIEQNIIKKQEDAKGIIGTLNELTGLKITNLDVLKKPVPKQINFHFINNRPDIKMLDIQQNQLKTLKTLYMAKRMPVFLAFGQIGYGRPGYDMLNNNFDTYYLVGIKLHWNIWDWNKIKNEKKILEIQNNILSVKKNVINQNMRAQLQKQKASIEKFQRLINTDNEIIALQQSVVDKTESQLKNGTIIPTNYILELNKLTKLKLEQKAHILQLIFAQYQYITLTGNL